MKGDRFFGVLCIMILGLLVGMSAAFFACGDDDDDSGGSDGNCQTYLNNLYGCTQVPYGDQPIHWPGTAYGEGYYDECFLAWCNGAGYDEIGVQSYYDFDATCFDASCSVMYDCARFSFEGGSCATNNSDTDDDWGDDDWGDDDWGDDAWGDDDASDCETGLSVVYDDCGLALADADGNMLSYEEAVAFCEGGDTVAACAAGCGLTAADCDQLYECFVDNCA